MKTRKPRILFLDTESGSLTAEWGRLICFGYKWSGSTTRVISTTDFPKAFAKDTTNDRHVAKAAARLIGEADLIVTWFGVKHDIPLINSRLLANGLPPLPPVLHLDGWKVAKDNLRLRSNGLANVTRFFGLCDKTPLKGDIWVKAVAGQPKAIRYVVEHCRTDCDVLEGVWKKIRVLDNTINLGNLGGRPGSCPRCGGAGGRFIVGGTRYTRTGKVARFQHVGNGGCGGWSQGKVVRNKEVTIR